jgi:hypothetical protein
MFMIIKWLSSYISSENRWLLFYQCLLLICHCEGVSFTPLTFCAVLVLIRLQEEAKQIICDRLVENPAADGTTRQSNIDYPLPQDLKLLLARSQNAHAGASIEGHSVHVHHLFQPRAAGGKGAGTGFPPWADPSGPKTSAETEIERLRLLTLASSQRVEDTQAMHQHTLRKVLTPVITAEHVLLGV